MVSFAQEVGAQLIAEGVEEPAELAAVQDLGVPWAQGYLLGRPGSLDGLAATG
jgi:EAL domain-containing protein (putative c-di-GMP-specific phosphodiesterase class I)